MSDPIYSIHKLQDAIIGILYILQRKIPIDCSVEFVLVDLLGNLRKFPVPDVATVADDAGEEDFPGRFRCPVFWLPMLEFIEKIGRVIHSGKGLDQRNVFPFREKSGQR